jgi:hypothetical protein
MVELKTLKDIVAKETVKGTFDLVWTQDLRAEAIKWIKHYEEKIDNQIADLNNYEQSEHEAVIAFIKHFFSITEADLK